MYSVPVAFQLKMLMREGGTKGFLCGKKPASHIEGPNPLGVAAAAGSVPGAVGLWLLNGLRALSV